ncbi:hypothetical protein BGZ65_003480 [Modicella reniformis]|uniref:Uncharacterized protein n=1 Tax=Modicella reniformis TaxID=1440133 RepID=A0A9P6SU10_9FUNG|nr:hypothetical protein BGZ65_003480 [Modicella reniformis]
MVDKAGTTATTVQGSARKDQKETELYTTTDSCMDATGSPAAHAREHNHNRHPHSDKLLSHTTGHIQTSCIAHGSNQGNRHHFAAAPRRDHKSKLAKHRKRRTEFVFGGEQERGDNEDKKDHEDEGEHYYQHQRQESQNKSHGPILCDEGHHLYHHDNVRHLHDLYPQPRQQQACQENQDSEHGPSSESIPNNNLSSREMDKGLPSTFAAVVDADSTQLTQPMQDLSIRKNAPGKLPQPRLPQSHHNSTQDHGDERKTQVSEQRHVRNHEQTQKGAPLNQTTSTSTTTLNISSAKPPSSSASGSSSHSATTSSQQPSVQLSRLLNPTPTASMPSITKITSQPVLTAISATHGKDDDHSSSTARSTAKEEEQRSVSIVSKFLTPYATGLRIRSRSHSTLQSSVAQGPPSRQRRHESELSNASSALSLSRANESGGGHYLISRFLPASPSKIQYSSPTPKAAPQSSTSVGVGSTLTIITAHPQRRRLPTSLRMTSTSFDYEMDQQRQGQGYEHDASADVPTTPRSIASSYSSAEGISSSSCSAWNTAESISRTQQKLMLQRASSQDDMDEEELVHRAKTLREMDRIQREYRCARLFADPILESLARCQARLEMEQQQQQTGEQSIMNPTKSYSASSLSISSMY